MVFRGTTGNEQGKVEFETLVLNEVMCTFTKPWCCLPHQSIGQEITEERQRETKVSGVCFLSEVIYGVAIKMTNEEKIFTATLFLCLLATRLRFGKHPVCLLSNGVRLGSALWCCDGCVQGLALCAGLRKVLLAEAQPRRGG